MSQLYSFATLSATDNTSERHTSADSDLNSSPQHAAAAALSPVSDGTEKEHVQLRFLRKKHGPGAKGYRPGSSTVAGASVKIHGVKTLATPLRRSRVILDRGKGGDFMTQKVVAKYITSHIKQRECNRYSWNQSPEDTDCECGREESWHSEQGLNVERRQRGAVRWDPMTHTSRSPCDSFGEIQFNGFGSTAGTAPYVRADYKTHPSVIWDLLINYWKMPQPRLLISVCGDERRFDLKPRASRLLKQGLIEASVNTGAWIITGGMAAGVMEFVGEAVRDHMTMAGHGRDKQCVALGIAPWGCVANKLALDGEGESGLYPATYNIEDVIHLPDDCWDLPLDHSHTHFLLVDRGNEGVGGAELNFRSNLESYISSVGSTGVSETLGIATPMVFLVMGGDLATLETVSQAVKRKTPVVVVNGTGGLADFIALGFHVTAHDTLEELSVFSEQFEKTMNGAAEQFLSVTEDGAGKQEELLTAVHTLKAALHHRSYINVFNLDKSVSVKEIDRVILYALIKANKTNCKSQLALALAWNRCDIARQEIFTLVNRGKWRSKDLYDAMFTSLVQNRVEFVKLFLDNGVELKKFLTARTLWNLYANCLADYSDGEAWVLRRLIIWLKQDWMSIMSCKRHKAWRDYPKENLLNDISRVMAFLLHKQSFLFYTDAVPFKMDAGEKACMEWKGEEPSIQPLLFRLSSLFSSSTGKEHLTTKQRQRQQRSKRKWWKQKLRQLERVDLEYPERDLFLFSVLFNRRGMAQLFLKLGQEQIGTALVGASLLKSFSVQAEHDEEMMVSADLLEHAHALEKIAISILDECYRCSKKDSHVLLVRVIPQLGNVTLLSLAERQELMDFAEHPACQTKLTELWKGCLTMHTSESKILLSIFLPVLVFFMKFKGKEGDISDEEEECQIEENKIYEMETASGTSHAGGAIKEEDESEGKNGGDTLSEDFETNVDNSISSTQGRSPFVRSKTRQMDHTKRSNFKNVRVLALQNENAITPWSAVIKFYNAPVTKFYSNLVTYIIFLALFSFFLLTDLRPIENDVLPSTAEYIVWVWLASMILEEARQAIIPDKDSLSEGIRFWWSDSWNRFDLVAYLVVVISVALRYELDSEHFVYARVAYTITLIMAYLRMMQFFYVDKLMGPKVIMIRRMCRDMLFFFFILVVFVLSFGVGYHISMYPNAPVDWTILYRVIYFPYFQIYGLIFVEDIEGEDVGQCTRNETIWREDPSKRCPEATAIAPFLFSVYMMLTNFLLVNLLIAMFSNTFQSVQENSTKVWHYHRIALIFEYFDKPSLVPPAIVFNHLWRAVRWCLFKTKVCGCSKRNNTFKLKLDSGEFIRLSLLEKAAMEVFLTNCSLKERDQLDMRVASTADRLDMVMDELHHIKEAIQLSEADKMTSGVLDIVALGKTGPHNLRGSSIACQLSEIHKESMHTQALLQKLIGQQLSIESTS